jgi:hypothetical protein
VLLQELRGIALFLPEQAQQQVFSSDVTVSQAFRFLGSISQDSLALVAQVKINRDGSRFLKRGVLSHLTPNEFVLHVE